MSFSYKLAEIATNKVAQLRYLIGDTVDAGHLMEDEELTFADSQAGNIFTAAADACEVIASKLSQEADRTIGDFSISSSQRSKAFSARAEALRARCARGAGAPVSADTSSSLFTRCNLLGDEPAWSAEAA